MSKTGRKYRVTDAEVRQSANVMHSFFVDYQAEFVAFDADLATPFEETWQEAIDNCTAHLNDETIRDQLQQRTHDVKAAMKACHDKHMATKYFVRKAFPNNPAALKVFGFDTFSEVSRRQLDLIQFMDVFHAEAADRAAELNAAGYSNADIAEIGDLHQALVDANVAQESFKGARGTKTEDRKRAYNALWEIMQLINRVSRLIYKDDPAKTKQFQLPAPVRKKKKEVETSATPQPTT
jgi:hypothetical protein